MIKYVAGFLFSENREQIALIRKNRPEWQAGKLNGIGGKIEDGEFPIQAMQRECLEECGLDIEDWVSFCKLSDAKKTWEVTFFRIFTDLSNITSMEEEKIEVISLENLNQENVISNLRWLIPMAMDNNFPYATVVQF